MSELSERGLVEVLSHIVDNRGRTCPTAAAGIPLIATNCLRRGRRSPIYERVRYVDEKTHREWFRSHLEPGDILFVCKGDPGRVAVVPHPVPFCVAQDMVGLRADSSIVDADYLYYRILSADVQGDIANMHVGTMIPHFKRGDFHKLRFSVHDKLDEQQAIAKLLKALDDKILLNERVVDKVDKLREAQVSAAASGGSRAPLSSLAGFINGRAFTKDATGDGRVVVRIAELNSGLGRSTVYNDISVADDHLARPGDLLFAWSGSLTVARWYREEAIINQHIFKVLPIDSHPIWLVDYAIRAKLAEFRAVAADKATTMGHIQRRSLDDPVSVPTAEDVRRLDSAMTSLWNRALAAEVESQQLERTRDELLPLLMSGKVRVKDAEKAVEEVL